MKRIVIVAVLGFLGYLGWRLFLGGASEPSANGELPVADAPPAPPAPPSPSNGASAPPPPVEAPKPDEMLAEAKRLLGSDEARARTLLAKVLAGDPKGASGREAATLLAPIAARSGDKRLEITLAWREKGDDPKIWTALEPLNAPLLDPRQESRNPQTEVHRVESGDTLERIARTHGSTIEMIRFLNGIEGDRIRIGDRLKVLSLKGRVSVEVRKSTFSCYLLYDGALLKRYPVGIGQEDLTPEGEFRIDNRLINPDWWKPGSAKPIPFGDKENILGTRWLGFAEPYRRFALHGTAHPETIGKKASNGCIRMRNADIEELYPFCPNGTPVTILP